MTALTLAMNEVQGVNSEEFPAVRAYHSLGVGFRYVFFDERNLSPASSISSGIESYGTTESERVSKDSGNDSGSESDQDKCKDTSDTSLAIIYDGRNILDLAKNVKPFTWQLSSFTQLSTPGFYFFKTPSKALHFYDPVRPSAPEICRYCSFRTPTIQKVRSSRR